MPRTEAQIRAQQKYYLANREKFRENNRAHQARIRAMLEEARLIIEQKKAASSDSL